MPKSKSDSAKKATEATSNPFLQETDPLHIFRSLAKVVEGWEGQAPELNQILLETLQDTLKNLAAFWETQVLTPNAEGDVDEDPRFQDPLWEKQVPFKLFKEQYKAFCQMVEKVVTEAPEVDSETREKALFWTDQMVQALSPSNFLLTNPVAIQHAIDSNGTSLMKGVSHWLEDVQTGQIKMVMPGSFKIGETMATTPGKVIFQNDLMELIQYTPTTPKVREVPLVFIPPFINKYYILDLTSKNSLVSYAIQEGFTVFMISWKNPDSSMRDTTWNDYMQLGAMAAIDIAKQVTSRDHVHPIGYCIGGTLLGCLMAWYNHPSHKGTIPVSHWSTFTTLLDFEDPGDIRVLINEDTVAFIEKQIKRSGFLPGNSMANTFRMLRADSLVWNYYVSNYLYGQDPKGSAILHWNSDNTRFPEAALSFYLRKFYLENQLKNPKGIEVLGRALDLSSIQQPAYFVATEIDHIAPWKQVFQVGSLMGGDVQFTLSTSGHIAGIVNPPFPKSKRAFWTGEGRSIQDAEQWKSQQTQMQGSWWPHWVDWLHERCGEWTEPPAMGVSFYKASKNAPGTYVFE